MSLENPSNTFESDPRVEAIENRINTLIKQSAPEDAWARGDTFKGDFIVKLNDAPVKYVNVVIEGSFDDCKKNLPEKIKNALVGVRESAEEILSITGDMEITKGIEWVWSQSGREG